MGKFVSSHNLMATLAIAAGLFATTAPVAIAVAQTTAPAAQAAPAQPAPARPNRPAPPLPGERIDAQLAYLKTALKITPAQEGQWNGLAAILRRQAEQADAEIKARRDAAQNPPAAAPDPLTRLQQRQQAMARQATRLDEILAAAKPLYASFSPEQKQVADRFLNRGPAGGMARGNQRMMRGERGMMMPGGEHGMMMPGGDRGMMMPDGRGMQDGHFGRHR